jgi:ferric-dicitrate binding protein FerR (iron transport regulator)
MMDKDNFLLLVTKVLSGNALPGDEVLLQNTLANHPEFQPLYDQYKRYWQQQNVSQSADVEKALAATWQKIQQAATATVPVTEAPVRRLFYMKRIAVAAALLGVMVTAAWFLFPARRQPAVEWVETYNPKGTRSSIVLPDGSKVWLAADSRLKYPKTFATNRRDLYLEGEAFFEVTRNPQKPFVVKLEAGAVRVLGTSFDIKAYKTHHEIITSVATGKVAFIPDHNTNDTFFLTPNRKSVYNINTRKTDVLETDALADKAWIDGTLLFDAVTLGEIAVTLERYYGKEVVFRDERLKAFRYTGTFANSSPAEILHHLSKTKAFTYTVSDSLIVIGQ